MLINDFSQQDFLQNKTSNRHQLVIEILTAGTIFLVPVIFLIIITS